MPKFIVESIHPQRGRTSTLVQATDAHAAVRAAQAQPQHVLRVQDLAIEQTPSKAATIVSPTTGRKRFPLRLFSQELAVLLAAGIPLLEGLETLREKESAVAVGRALDDVISCLRRGQPLSMALKSQPESFDALYVAVVQSSERTGQLEQALREHAAYLAWVDALRSKLVSASIYPLTLIVAGMAVIVFLLLFVVPRFAGILEGVGGTLPPTSQMLVDVGRLTGGHPGLTAGTAMALLVTPVLVSRVPGVRAWVIERLWHLPLLGPKLHLLALAQFYRTASMLLSAGVPAVGALRTSRAVISLRLRAALDGAIGSVGQGERLSAALQQAGLTTPVSLRMVRVGERSGSLGPMLRQAAEFYDDELSRLTDLITHLVNPLLMLVMGVVIGSIVVLMYMPIFQLVEQVQ